MIRVTVPKDYPRNLPSAYERSKLSETQRRWGSPMGGLVRRFLPQILPGVPAEAHMGFASNGSELEDVGLTPSHASFHELGYYGIEGGPYQTPAPNRDTSKPNSWYRLHNDSRVRGLLGRDATMVPWATHNAGTSQASAEIPLEDQIAVGIVNVADALSGMAANLPASIRPQSRSSLWATALSFMGWSNGVGGASAHIRKYERQLAAVPESQRWLALIRAVAADTTDGPGASYTHAAYSVNRANQKVRVGRGLARAVGGANLPWFGEVDEVAEDILARRASSVTVPTTPGGTPQPPPAIPGEIVVADESGDRNGLIMPSSGPSTGVIVGVAVVVLGVAGFVAWTIGKKKARENPTRRRRR